MRSSRILSAATAGVLLAAAGGAQALTASNTFNVTANVAANCQVSGTDLAFGAFTGAANVDSTSTITVNCSNGAPYSLALDVGTGGGSFAARQLAKTSGPPAPGVLVYNLYRDTARTEIWGDGVAASTFTVGGTGTGVGNALPHTVYGRLPSAGNSNPVVGGYSSIVTVTITY
jgi:spore coat protein U-like protein